MIEVIAALVGAAFTAAVMGTSTVIRGNTNNREVVTRLTVAVENVATRLEELHVDIKADRKEMFARLNSVEQRVATLEARTQIHHL
jgi:outer membrane murein-binding lipoprotein Lpp